MTINKPCGKLVESALIDVKSGLAARKYKSLLLYDVMVEMF